MLNVFVSSTSKDLIKLRKRLLKELNYSVDSIGMEDFTPGGIDSLEQSIENLRKSDIVIFLISPYYGSSIEKCKIKDCQVKKCEMHPTSNINERISFTHCEFRVAIAEKKQHQTYLIEKDLDIIKLIKKQKDKGLDINELRNDEIFEGKSDEEIEHYIKIGLKSWEFINEIDSKENYFTIENTEDLSIIQIIKKHLADNILNWHSKGIINFSQFSDRRDELFKIVNNSESCIEVYGVGGIGKTSLIQVALLIIRLKGKNIIALGTKQKYISGSGYEYFKRKCKGLYHEIPGQKINLDDIIDALSSFLEDLIEVKKLETSEKIKTIVELIEREDIVLFIDDIHLADKDVEDFIQNTDNLVLSSKKRSGLAKRSLLLIGIPEEERESLINFISLRYNIKLRKEDKKKIGEMTEGHPLSTDFLIRNYGRIDFDDIKEFMPEGANDRQVEEFYRRLMKEILSEEEYDLLKALSVINTDLPDNIDKKIIKSVYATGDKDKYLITLIETDMLIKREENQSALRFSFSHFQEALKKEVIIDNHLKAIEYYEKCNELYSERFEDRIELLYHQIQAGIVEPVILDFIHLKESLEPLKNEFRRLIEVGELLKTQVAQNSKNKPIILAALGDLNFILMRYKYSEEYYIKALEIYNKNYKDAKSEILIKKYQIYRNLARLYIDLNKYFNAKVFLQDAMDTIASLSELFPNSYLPELTEMNNLFGICHMNLKEFKKAEQVFTNAKELYNKFSLSQQKKKLTLIAEIYNNLGKLYFLIEKYNAAEQQYEEALEKYKRLAELNNEKFSPFVANTENNLGDLYKKSKKFEDAKKAYIRVLNIYQELSTKNPNKYLQFLANAYNKLGLFCKELKEFDDAKDYFKDAEETYQKLIQIYKTLREKHPDFYLPYLIMTLKNLGDLYLNLSRFEDAQNGYQQAIQILELLIARGKELFSSQYGSILNNLAKTFYHKGRYELSIETNEKALNYVEDITLKSKILIDIGGTYRFTGKTDEALENLKDAENISVSALNKTKIMFKRAIIEHGRNELQKASELYSKALKLAIKNKFQQEMGSDFFNLLKLFGDLAFQQNDYKLAKERWSLMKNYSNEFKDIHFSKLSEARLSLVEENMNLDEMERAWHVMLIEYQEAKEEASELTSYGELAEVYIRKKDFNYAITLCEKAEDIFQRIKNLHTEGGISYVQGVKSLAEKKISSAKELFKHSEELFGRWTSPFRYWVSNTYDRLNSFIN